jgi:hypothetical protein
MKNAQNFFIFLPMIGIKVMQGNKGDSRLEFKFNLAMFTYSYESPNIIQIALKRLQGGW